MSPKKEAKVKANCFNAAALIISRTMKTGCPVNFENISIQIYSLGIEIFHNGKDRYWKETNYDKIYDWKPRLLKRIYTRLKESLWEKRVPK